MTDEQILNLAETILQEEEEFMIPVLKLQGLMKQEKESWTFRLDDLIDLLKNDQRFKIYESESTHEPWPEEDEAEMMKLGYLPGPRVMLKTKIPSKEELIQVMQEKMQKTMESLKIAYKVKPDNLDDDQEEEFLQIMKKTKDLQRKLEDTFNGSDS